jgi:hypothetical protein
MGQSSVNDLKAFVWYVTLLVTCFAVTYFYINALVWAEAERRSPENPRAFVCEQLKDYVSYETYERRCRNAS